MTNSRRQELVNSANGWLLNQVDSVTRRDNDKAERKVKMSLRYENFGRTMSREKYMVYKLSLEYGIDERGSGQKKEHILSVESGGKRKEEDKEEEKYTNCHLSLRIAQNSLN